MAAGAVVALVVDPEPLAPSPSELEAVDVDSWLKPSRKSSTTPSLFVTNQ